MLDPKVAKMVSKELESESIIVFDEAHNIDSVCIEALSVTINDRGLDQVRKWLVGEFSNFFCLLQSSCYESCLCSCGNFICRQQDHLGDYRPKLHVLRHQITEGCKQNIAIW